MTEARIAEGLRELRAGERQGTLVVVTTSSTLLAVADEAGNEWPHVAREAALFLTRQAQQEDHQQSEGIDLLTVDQDLAARLMQSEMLRPADGTAGAAAGGAAGGAAKSVEERLRELDDLHERGVISAEERAEARAKILGG